MSYRVTILISFYNSAKFIEHKLKNLRSQTIFSECEVMFINGGSEHDEKKYIVPFVEKYPNCKYLESKKRITIYDAWNRGIQASTAPLICNSNTDDVLAPNAIEKLCSALEDDKEAYVAFPNIYTTPIQNPNWGDIRGGYINTSEKGVKGPFVMWRRTLHDQFGLFNPKLWVIGDSVFWSRVISKKFIKVSDYLAIYVVRNGMEKQRAPDGELYRVKDAKFMKYPRGWVDGY